MEARREPDALDGARVVALVLVAVAAIGATGLPAGARSVLLQAAFCAIPLVYARMSGLRPLRDAGFTPPRGLDVLLTFAASMASLWILKGLSDLQLEVFRPFGTDEIFREETVRIERTVKRAEEAVGVLGLSFFFVIPPLCEELLFRGLMLRGFAKGFGAGRALLYTSLIFAAMHGTAVQVLLMTFLGLYFGALAWLGGSLWLAVFAHAVNNAAVIALQVGYGPRVQDFRASPIVLALSVLVFAGVLVYFALGRRSRAIREAGPAS